MDEQQATPTAPATLEAFFVSPFWMQTNPAATGVEERYLNLGPGRYARATYYRQTEGSQPAITLAGEEIVALYGDEADEVRARLRALAGIGGAR